MHTIYLCFSVIDDRFFLSIGISYSTLREKTVKLANIELFFRPFVLNWGGCWTEEFLVLNWAFFGFELRYFGAEKEWPFCVEPMCWTKWSVELRGTRFWVFKYDYCQLGLKRLYTGYDLRQIFFCLTVDCETFQLEENWPESKCDISNVPFNVIGPYCNHVFHKW